MRSVDTGSEKLTSSRSPTPAGLCYVADEGGRECVAGLPAAGLGGPRSCREFHGLPVFPSPNGGYWRIVLDGAGLRQAGEYVVMIYDSGVYGPFGAGEGQWRML